MIAVFLSIAGIVKFPQSLDKAASLDIKPTKFIKQSWIARGGGESFVYSIYGMNAMNQEVSFNLPGNVASLEILKQMTLNEPTTLWIRISDFRFIVQIKQNQKLILDYARASLDLKEDAKRFLGFALFALVAGLGLISASRYKNEK